MLSGLFIARFIMLYWVPVNNMVSQGWALFMIFCMSPFVDIPLSGPFTVHTVAATGPVKERLAMKIPMVNNKNKPYLLFNFNLKHL